jgi:hypothetical protein
MTRQELTIIPEDARLVDLRIEPGEQGAWNAVDALGKVRFTCSSFTLLEETLPVLSEVLVTAAQLARNAENVGLFIKGWHKFVV